MILQGHVLDKLAEMEAESVSCCATSPPYWSLRKYEAGDVVWGGRAGCEHEWGTVAKGGAAVEGYAGKKKWQHTVNGRGEDHPEARHRLENPDDWTRITRETSTCARCGAWRGQYGLEPTPELYVEHTLDVLRAIRRVLRPDGVVWWNIGDGYAGGNGTGGGPGDKQFTNVGSRAPATGRVVGLKPKDLVLMPSRVALAAQADGWWVRSVIVWSKPNAMPESTKDRPTTAHEYVLQLVKGQWSTRVIQAANFPDERVHFGKDFGLSGADSWCGQFCIRLATALFDFAQRQEEFSLPPFYAEEWQEFSDNADGGAVASVPAVKRAAALASRLLTDDVSTKEFLCQMHSLWIALGDADDFLKRWRASLAFTPSVYSDGDTSVAVNDSGQIRKFDLLHNLIVHERPTTCNYWYDQEAVREAHGSTAWAHQLEVYERRHGAEKHTGMKPPEEGMKRFGTTTAERYNNPAGRNMRSVWEFPTAQTPEAHFATFPEELPRRCIEASCPREICAKCGMARVRLVEKTDEPDTRAKGSRFDSGKTGVNGEGRTQGGERFLDSTTGWTSCSCTEPDYQPGIVLDPFAGIGTTGIVAKRLGRRFVGIELSEKYAEMARAKLAMWWRRTEMVASETQDGQSVLPLETTPQEVAAATREEE